ncbi:polysaccharide pyruvyl transferase family protein [Lacticaseibacillus porcinae]|uniref:polysaccharide pyruvyl transferase family protein n=1 Tax=Lacticaseibacillus porcinae TaxID=1123687 RepID=UPI000F7B8893|nr:polysaccharide pyruvyl transferase family protein [Lacticaseibacillus porcinae]
MFKIEVLTFTNADNYGAVLQNMGLIQTLKQIPDVEVETLDYHTQNIESPYLFHPFQVGTKNPIKFSIRVAKNFIFARRFRSRSESFKAFRTEKLQLSVPYTDSKLKKVPPRADLFVVGSDQVWNSAIVGHNSQRIYSLGFVTNAKKISYAASSGDSRFISQETINELRKYDFVSVRERELEHYLEQNNVENIRRDVDPVFLVDEQEWRKFSDVQVNIPNHYIFVYSVGPMMKKIASIADELSLRTGFPIIYVDFHEKHRARAFNRFGASPAEFVNYIRNADYVLASSFHAVAFSVIFRKKFLAIPHVTTGARIIDILESLNLSSRIYSGKIEQIFEPLPKQLDQIRKEYTVRSKSALECYIRTLINGNPK